ncbi:MAG: hypothetical protein Tsb0014_21240 [Pleurocapsa sp.]
MRILTSVCCTAVLLPISGLSAQANPTNETSQEQSPFSETELIKSQQENPLIGGDSEIKADSSWTDEDKDEVEDVLLQLQNIRQRNFEPSRGAPSLTLANPYGYGADRGFYTGLGYTTDTRGGATNQNEGDATWGFGLGFGNAQKAVGAELSYTIASFGTTRDFGSGGFNAKIHRQIMPDWSIAAGWNSFLSIGDDNDWEDSIYLATTKIFKTRENLNSAFSRMAVTAGVGNGQFRSNDAIQNGDEGFNVFGSLAFRVAQPVSFITEWTGQDLAMGLSVSPIETIPVTVNLGLRDIAGAGDKVRFVFGIGAGF